VLSSQSRARLERRRPLERTDIAGVLIDIDHDPGIRCLMLSQSQRDACDELPSEQVIPHHGVAPE
jgi:hypothetical protein